WRAAFAGTGKIQTWEWINSAVQRKARAATGGGESRLARGKRSQPHGSSRAGEHDRADAAAGNGNALCATDRGSRGGSGRDAEFWRGEGYHGYFHAIAHAKLSRCTGIARGRGPAPEFSTIGN